MLFYRTILGTYLYFSLLETPLGEGVGVEIRWAAHPHEVAATRTPACELTGKLGVKHLKMDIH